MSVHVSESKDEKDALENALVIEVGIGIITNRNAKGAVMLTETRWLVQIIIIQGNRTISVWILPEFLLVLGPRHLRILP